jgi:glycosyltransferase involved in cell wall biosynthesis
MKKNFLFPGGFSVLMAVYRGDQAELFCSAVISVMSNDLLPNQFLIVIDGPLSNLLEDAVIRLNSEYPLIQFIRLPENKGLAQALNVGLREVKYSWVVRADADDINLPMRFSTLAKTVFENPKLQLLGSAILEVDQDNKPVAIRDVPCSEDEIRRFVKLRCPFNHMSTAYRLDAVLACGGYPDIYLKEDYGLWCHFLALHFQVMNVKDVLVHASAGINMYQRRGGWRYAQSEWKIQVLLINSDLKSIFRGFIDGLLRTGFFLLPAELRGFIYIKLLRSSYRKPY